MSLSTVMVISLLGCMNSPVSDPNGLNNSPELTSDATATQAELPRHVTIANTRTNKIGTQVGTTTPEFTLLMSDGNTRIFPTRLETDKPIFLLFFTPH